MSANDKNNQNPQQPRNIVGGIADKWRNLSSRNKKIIAGGTAFATLGGVAGGLMAADHEVPLSPEQVNGGQLAYDSGEQPLRDGSGKAALLNYFEADAPAEDRVLRVSLATQLPQSFRNGHQQGDFLDTVQNSARSHTHRTEVYFVTVCHSSGEGRTDCNQEMRTRTVTDHHYYRYNLDIEGDFVPANNAQEQQLREYFKEFEQLTGIKVQVSYNDPEAHITVANYRNAPDYYRGTLDYVRPGSIATYPEGASVSGEASLQRNVVIMNDRNWGADKGLLDEIGKPLGFKDGKVNIVTLRAELERLGLPVSQLAVEDTTYEMQNGREGTLLMPDNVIIDNGGSNTLVGSDKNDTLVSEAGMCGHIDTPRNKLTNIFGNGREYCIAEGELALVRAGAGDDLIVTARGGGQTIEPGAGHDRIAVFTPDIGDITILAQPQEEGSNTLYLHDAKLHSGEVSVAAEGSDIALEFKAFSGRDVGRITLPQQLEGGGVDRIVVVDDKGKEVFAAEVRDLNSLEQWQEKLLNPMEKAVDKKMQGAAQEEAASWRQQVSRRRENEGEQGFSI